ncbi:MAG: DinB family protein [Acidobacteriota bacterium]
MNQRPAKDEAAEYFWAYIDKVPGDDIVAALKAQTAEFTALLGRVSEEASLGRYEPWKWSVREVTGHINDCERVFAYRALWFARGLEGGLPSMDQDACVAHAGSNGVTMAALAAEFQAVRAATMAMVKSLPAEAWDRRGVSSGMPLSVRGAVWIICGHVEHHTQLFRERYGLS